MGAMLSSPVDSIVVERAGCSLLRAAVATTQGWRFSHEDSHVMVQPKNARSPFFFAVLDGHGGDEVALQMETMLPRHVDVETLPPITSLSIIDVMKSRFIAADHEARSKLPNSCPAGSTCTSALITPLKTPEGTWAVTFSNAGDSRSLVIRANGSFMATDDHKPENPMELARIEKAGGTVSREVGGPYRVDSNLAVSRSFGDFEYKDVESQAEAQKISCVPDVTVGIEIKDGDFVLLCCDGIFDVMTNEECVEFVLGSDHQDLGILCANLVNVALEKGSRDNCSAMVVQVGEKAVAEHVNDDAIHATSTQEPTRGFHTGYHTSMLMVGSVPTGQHEHDDMTRDKFEQFHNMFGYRSLLPPPCSSCYDVYLGMRVCSRCRNRQYCSQFCQRKDWIDGHSTKCGKETSSCIAKQRTNIT